MREPPQRHGIAAEAMVSGDLSAVIEEFTCNGVHPRIGWHDVRLRA